MANNFKLYCTSLADTNETTLITATTSSVFIISSIIISNTHATTDTTVTLTVTDTSAATDFKILPLEEVKRTRSVEVLSRPLVLENLDILKIQATTGGIFDVMVSYLDRDRD